MADIISIVVIMAFIAIAAKVYAFPRIAARRAAKKQQEAGSGSAPSIPTASPAGSGTAAGMAGLLQAAASGALSGIPSGTASGIFSGIPAINPTPAPAPVKGTPCFTMLMTGQEDGSIAEGETFEGHLSACANMMLLNAAQRMLPGTAPTFGIVPLDGGEMLLYMVYMV